MRVVKTGITDYAFDVNNSGPGLKVSDFDLEVSECVLENGNLPV
jgi:hypothetical protein